MEKSNFIETYTFVELIINFILTMVYSISAYNSRCSVV